MNIFIDDLIFQKYEKFSVYYIIEIDKLEKFIKKELEINPDISYKELDNNLDIYIDEHFYYNLINHSIDDFNTKIKNNIKLAQIAKDYKYLDYIKRKFDVTEDLLTVDLMIWNYNSKKIKIKLKVSNLNNKKEYKVKQLLSDFLEIPDNHSFEYKSDIIRLIHLYIYENKLQEIENKNIFVADDHLKNILLPLKDIDSHYTYENLPLYLEHLII